MKIIIEIATGPQGAIPSLRMEGQAQIGTLLQALDWAKTQLLAQTVGTAENTEPPNGDA